MNIHDHEISNPQEIVVVDDTLESLQLLTDILQKHGYKVRPVSSALLGLETVAARLPDLILLDVKMPDMDGYEVCRRLKSAEQSRMVPVIFISALGETAEKVEGFKAGWVDFITKPVDSEELLARVKTHLKLQELTGRLEQKVRERTSELETINKSLREEIFERRQAEEALKRIEWMLSKKHTSTMEGPENGQNQGYGDLTALNRDGVILKSIGHDVLGSIAADYLDLLGTSSAIYEVNGDYAFGIFASNWCRMLDRASRKLCDTDDNAAALISGQWLCHESCWTRCSKEAIETRAPVDIECSGGIRLYGVPIVAGETVIGSINFGYGDIPNDPVKLRALANAYHLNYEDLLAEFNIYNSRPPYIVEMAKSRLHASAKLIGILVERQHAEEEIHKLNDELEQRVADRTALLEAAIKELEAFAYTVSHNLRAPLRHIDGFLELLQKRTATALDEQSRHYIGTVSESAKHMGVLIDDLLSFSRMGRNQMSELRVDLGELTREVIREYEPETGSRNILWRVCDLPVVNGDHAMLRIVLVNLISNALKFTQMRPQAEIEIGWMGAQEGETVFFVRDNGVGFDMTYSDKLFGIFQRLHRADEFAGTGIGLANVHRIINRHGGRTWAEGEIGRGATFYFSLPQAIQEI